MAKSHRQLRVVSDSAVVPSPAKRTPRVDRELGVVEQVRVAFRRTNRLAACMGALLGGFVPLATYFVAHGEVDRGVELYAQLSTYLVLGGLLFSARTVYSWALLAFGSGAKALGFCVLAEGVMTTSSTAWLAVAALVYLCSINGIATACILVVRRPRSASRTNI
jgi:hypothetical protein